LLWPCRDFPTCDDGCGALGFCKIFTTTGVTATGVDDNVAVEFTYRNYPRSSIAVYFAVDASVDVDADLDSNAMKITLLATFAWASQECSPPVTFTNPAVLSPIEMRLDPAMSTRDRDMTRGVGGDHQGNVVCVL